MKCEKTTRIYLKHLWWCVCVGKCKCQELYLVQDKYDLLHLWQVTSLAGTWKISCRGTHYPDVVVHNDINYEIFTFVVG